MKQLLLSSLFILTLMVTYASKSYADAPSQITIQTIVNHTSYDMPDIPLYAGQSTTQPQVYTFPPYSHSLTYRVYKHGLPQVCSFTIEITDLFQPYVTAYFGGIGCVVKATVLQYDDTTYSITLDEQK